MMAYQTLVAHVSNEAVSESILDAACLLADRHAAHLVGLHITPPLDVYVSDVPFPVQLTDHYLEQQQKLEKRIYKLFDEKTTPQYFVSEWRQVDSSLVSVRNVLIEQGNTSDLLIIGRTEGDDTDSRFKDLPEHVLTACGRPVLVIPPEHPIESMGERVLVAWDGRRESTRAVFGALPMLRRAAQVRLQRINLPHQDRHHFMGATEELANTLARHGVAVEVFSSDAQSREIADELLGYSKDIDADLLVMGCYGHGPIREFLLGGTTRKILADTQIPGLMTN
jgi:nucleotide-binding universal stress UspA family protein